jgi:hypothetical protein
MCVGEDMLRCEWRDVFVLARGFLHPLEDAWVPEQGVPTEKILDSMCMMSHVYTAGGETIQACEFENECEFDGEVGSCPYCCDIMDSTENEDFLVGYDCEGMPIGG